MVFGDNICVVCYEETKDRILPCNHFLCVMCMNKWFKKKCRCPYCIGVPTGHTKSSGRGFYFSFCQAKHKIYDTGNCRVYSSTNLGCGVLMHHEYIVSKINNVPIFGTGDARMIIELCNERNIKIKVKYRDHLISFTHRTVENT